MVSKDGYTLILRWDTYSAVCKLSGLPELNSVCAYAEALLRVDTAANENRDFCGLEQPK